MRKYLISKENIKGNTIEILGDDFHHLKTVLRQKIGDKVICLTETQKFSCVIKNFTNNSCLCEIETLEEIVNKNNIEITIFQAEIKTDKFELIIQKANELGVKEITPFKSKFSQNNYYENKQERFTKIAKESSKQCVRNIPIQMNKIISFEEMLEQIKNYDLCIFAYEKSSQSLKEVLNETKDINNIAIIVGPEGGFSEEEFQILNQFCKTVSLGDQILRAETACLFLTSIITFYFSM